MNNDPLKCSKRFYTRMISFFSVFLILCSFWSCNSSKNIKKPELAMLEMTLAKGIKEVGQKDVLLNPGTSFSSHDTAVIAYIKFGDMSGQHKVQWKWYGPDGDIYYTTAGCPLSISKGKYVKEASAWHKISIMNDKAQDFPGKWKVEIYLDDKLAATEHFEIRTDIYDIAFSVDTNIPNTGMDNPNAIAVVIGNQNYQHSDIPPVKFAHNDANAVRNYLIKTFGYKEGNIIFETDITKAKFEVLFGISSDHRGLLYDFVKPGKSDVFIYYSGHGAPDISTQKGYFVPADCDPSKISFNGYALEVFYNNISKLKARTMTIVLDACFSGGTNTGEWLIPDASPAMLKVKEPIFSFENMVVLTSATNDQISSWHSDQEHGLFTYFFLKAIAGLGDKDKNKKLTYNEVFDYISDKTEGVPYWARRLYGRMQNPVLYGNGEGVFVAY